jgi:hypothetical protein
MWYLTVSRQTFMLFSFHLVAFLSLRPYIHTALRWNKACAMKLFFLSCRGSLRVKPAPWLPMFLECLSSIGRCMTCVLLRKTATIVQQLHCTVLVPTEGCVNTRSQRQKGDLNIRNTNTAAEKYSRLCINLFTFRIYNIG